MCLKSPKSRQGSDEGSVLFDEVTDFHNHEHDQFDELCKDQAQNTASCLETTFKPSLFPRFPTKALQKGTKHAGMDNKHATPNIFKKTIKKLQKGSNPKKQSTIPLPLSFTHNKPTLKFELNFRCH